MISIRQTTWFTYEDADGWRRWIEGSNVASGTQGEIYIDSGNDRFRYCEGNGQVREVTIGQTSSTGSKGEVYVTGKRWAWCPSDNTEHSRRGDRNNALGFSSFNASEIETDNNAQAIELNYTPNEVKNYFSQQFEIQRFQGDSLPSSGDWNTITTTTDTQVVDSSVSEFTDYQYRVKEIVTRADGTNSSIFSGTESVTTGEEPVQGIQVSIAVQRTSYNSWDLSAAVTGGNSPYSYDWQEANGKFMFWQPSRTVKDPSVTASNGTAGDQYVAEVTVTDDNGQTAQASAGLLVESRT